jgi:polysaccharide chain length determinant protein (PEP-CTERM system associated)
MLPGKRTTPDAILKILKRRYWLAFVPFALIAAFVAAAARTLPNVYTSETVIRVEPQRIPESYVKNTITARIEDRLETIRSTILSRTRLERIILDFDLYPDERKTMVMEDVVGLMSRNVDVKIVQGDAFRVAYTGRDPVKVMKVTDRLAHLFIDENLVDRQNQAQGTDDFLESALVEAKAKLLASEKRVMAYRQTYAGQLPTQMDANLQQIQSARMQIRDNRESINRDLDRRLLLERQLGDLQAPSSVADVTASTAAQATPGGPLPTPAGGTTAQQLAAAQTLLESQQLRYKPGHPDLEATKRRIEELQVRLAAESSTTSPRPRVVSAADQLRQRNIENLKTDMAELDRQIARKQDEEKRLQGVADDVQRRVDALPTRESELTELTRDYGTLQDNYRSLLQKKSESEMAANLERRNVGEQFKLLDPAQLPERPSSPNRPMINLVGMVAGLAVGAVLVGIVEVRDNSFRTDEEVAAVLALPVLAVVPAMQSDADRKSALWRRLLLSAGLGTLVAACLVFVAYAFVR